MKQQIKVLAIIFALAIQGINMRAYGMFRI